MRQISFATVRTEDWAGVNRGRDLVPHPGPTDRVHVQNRPLVEGQAQARAGGSRNDERN